MFGSEASDSRSQPYSMLQFYMVSEKVAKIVFMVYADDPWGHCKGCRMYQYAERFAWNAAL